MSSHDLDKLSTSTIMRLLLSYKLQLDLKRLMQDSKGLLFGIRVGKALANVRLAISKFIVTIKQNKKKTRDISLHVVMQMISFNKVTIWISKTAKGDESERTGGLKFQTPRYFVCCREGIFNIGLCVFKLQSNFINKSAHEHSTLFYMLKCVTDYVLQFDNILIKNRAIVLPCFSLIKNCILNSTTSKQSAL